MELAARNKAQTKTGQGLEFCWRSGVGSHTLLGPASPFTLLSMSAPAAFPTQIGSLLRVQPCTFWSGWGDSVELCGVQFVPSLARPYEVAWSLGSCFPYAGLLLVTRVDAVLLPEPWPLWPLPATVMCARPSPYPGRLQRGSGAGDGDGGGAGGSRSAADALGGPTGDGVRFGLPAGPQVWLQWYLFPRPAPAQSRSADPWVWSLGVRRLGHDPLSWAPSGPVPPALARLWGGGGIGSVSGPGGLVAVRAWARGFWGGSLVLRLADWVGQPVRALGPFPGTVAVDLCLQDRAWALSPGSLYEHYPVLRPGAPSRFPVYPWLQPWWDPSGQKPLPGDLRARLGMLAVAWRAQLGPGGPRIVVPWSRRGPASWGGPARPLADLRHAWGAFWAHVAGERADLRGVLEPAAAAPVARTRGSDGGSHGGGRDAGGILSGLPGALGAFPCGQVLGSAGSVVVLSEDSGRPTGQRYPFSPLPLHRRGLVWTPPAHGARPGVGAAAWLGGRVLAIQVAAEAACMAPGLPWAPFTGWHVNSKLAPRSAPSRVWLGDAAGSLAPPLVLGPSGPPARSLPPAERVATSPAAALPVITASKSAAQMLQPSRDRTLAWLGRLLACRHRILDERLWARLGRAAPPASSGAPPTLSPGGGARAPHPDVVAATAAPSSPGPGEDDPVAVFLVRSIPFWARAGPVALYVAVWVGLADPGGRVPAPTARGSGLPPLPGWLADAVQQVLVDRPGLGGSIPAAPSGPSIAPLASPSSLMIPDPRVLVLLCGPSGSGKSTLARALAESPAALLPGFGLPAGALGCAVNQDTLGSRHACVAAAVHALIRECPAVVIDRVNLTRDQRAIWYDLALTFALTRVAIIGIIVPVPAMLTRILARASHPTLGTQDGLRAVRSVLSRQLSDWEPPRLREWRLSPAWPPRPTDAADLRRQPLPSAHAIQPTTMASSRSQHRRPKSVHQGLGFPSHVCLAQCLRPWASIWSRLPQPGGGSPEALAARPADGEDRSRSSSPVLSPSAGPVPDPKQPTSWARPLSFGTLPPGPTPQSPVSTPAQSLPLDWRSNTRAWRKALAQPQGRHLAQAQVAATRDLLAASEDLRKATSSHAAHRAVIGRWVHLQPPQPKGSVQKPFRTRARRSKQPVRQGAQDRFRRPRDPA